MRQWLGRYLIQSNLWISLGAGLWAYATGIALSSPNSHYAILAFSATLFTYNYQRIVKVRRGYYSGQSSKLGKKNVRWIATIIGGIGTSYEMWHLFDKLLVWYLPLGILVLFYVFPLKWKSRLDLSLRKVPSFKIFVIGLSWSLVCGWIPATLSGLDFLEAFAISASYFFFVIAISVPFDIRDMHFDESSLRTIPQVMGMENAKLLSNVLLALNLLGLALTMIKWGWEGQFWAALVASSMAFIFIRKSSPSSPRWYFSFALDGTIILWAVMLIAVSRFP